MNGSFCDFCLQICVILPITNECIVTCYHQTQDLAHEIKLAQDTICMEHEFIHHFVQALCRNGAYGFTHNNLQAFLVRIRDMRRSSHQTQYQLPFPYHEVF
jgi:hypothetical protein